MEFLRQLLNGLRDAWQRLTVSARINIVLAFLAAAAIVLFVVYAGSRPQYVTLSSNLSPGDMTQIIDVLEQEGIAYRTAQNNTVVMVPADTRSRAQLLLAEGNLPIGQPATPGFEILQQTDLMTTQYQQRVQFMRAVQGEIQRQLTNLDFVQAAYVIIREAPDELFTRFQEPSEASVTLQVRRMPTARETKALVNMVARAGGADLHPKNITVITTDGTVLHDPSDDEFASIASSKLEYLADLERMRERRIEESLATLGVRGTARVSAKVNFTQTEVKSEKVDEGAEVSTFTTTSTLTTTDVPPEGAPGALANIPPGAAAAAGVQTSEETSEEIVNLEPSRTVTNTTTNPGDVESYLVTLIVEGNYETGADGNRTYVGLEEADRQKYIDLAKAAVGVGDVETQVTVYDQAFDISDLAGAQTGVAAMQNAETRQWVLQLGWYAVQVVLILVGFLLIRSFLRRAIEIPDEEPLERELPTAAPEVLRRQEVEGEVRRMSDQEPEMVSALLRTWMTQEEE
ncbi:MAG: flagellar M-ring protein FliF [Candidatus Hydrogenedentes bacterium]|nr:flagellar M-ring protein FliF [Candidatus Hydrogenedentota bacterium]